MALSELCIATKTSIGALIILALLLAIITYVLSIYFQKRKILKSLSKLLFICVGVGIILYLITPFTINYLVGIPNPSITECQQPTHPPYCGHTFCEQNNYAYDENCTCIQW
jgi:hypothetical protein